MWSSTPWPQNWHEVGPGHTPRSIQMLSPGLKQCSLCGPHLCDQRSQLCQQLLPVIPGKEQMGI